MHKDARTHISLAWRDTNVSVQGFTGPGFYLSAADPEKDNHLWLVEPRRLTPSEAVDAAKAIDRVLGTALEVVVRKQCNFYASELERIAASADAALAKAETARAELEQYRATLPESGN